MNAPAEQRLFDKVDAIPLAAICPSETHIQALRRKRFTKEALAELAESIKKVGVLQAVVVRPLKALRGLAKYELVAGERRWLAAKQADLAHIIATVRNLSDEEVLEIQLIENLQREGLHELEEAEGYDELMKLKKINADGVAEMVGKSRSYVYARTKLLALCPEARTMFYAGELDASRALLIARIGHHDTQRQALADITKGEEWNGRREGQPMSYREAHRHIVDHYMLKLSSAPFDIKDANLVPKAGACPPCPKRTGNQADLFGDVKSADICTDPKCFDDKRQAVHAVARKKHEAAGRKVISGAEAKKLLPHWERNDNGHISDRSYVRLDESEYIGGRYQKVADALGKDYQPILLQHPLTGKFIEIAPRSTVASKAAQKTKERNKKGATGGAVHTPAASKPAEPDYGELTAERIGQLIYRKLTGAMERELLLYIAEVESEAWGANVGDWLLKLVGQPTAGWRSNFKKLSDKDLVRFLTVGTLADGLYHGGSSARQFAISICKRFKLDPKKVEVDIRAEVKKKRDAEKAAADANSAKPKASAPAKKKTKKPTTKKGKGKKK